MTKKTYGASNLPDGKRPPFWKSSVYDEPTWVSLAWIIGPLLLACVALYFAVR